MPIHLGSLRPETIALGLRSRNCLLYTSVAQASGHQLHASAGDRNAAGIEHHRDAARPIA